MDWLQALVLGIVEGLTEYLPVSSTGHLLLTQRWMEIPKDEASHAFAIAIQAGAIVAVLGLYRARVGQIFRGLAGKDVGGRKLALALLVAFAPAAVLGPLFDEKIEEQLAHPAPICLALLVGGLAILGGSFWRRQKGRTEQAAGDLLSLSLRGALVIGLIQCLAMWPGTSRSLVTIVGGLLVGLRMAAAVEFSFLLGLVTLGAATAYTAVNDGALMLESYGILPLLIGFLGAWVAAVISVKWMVAWLQKHGLEIFGYYRVILAAVVWFVLVD
ncbi:MAG: UDP-diphosphatase [Planctomycetota bacterium]|nr:MAG: UDP-diphosphatase [Planctomycetota bacterium]